MSKKVNQKSNTVAFFDDPDTVDEPGFYLVDGGEETSEVKVYDGGEFAVTGEEEGEDGVKIPVLEADGRGRPVFAKAPEHKETISVSHNTNGKPGRRVYPAPDGDGFTFDAPKVDDNPDKWETKGGEG